MDQEYYDPYERYGVPRDYGYYRRCWWLMRAAKRQHQEIERQLRLLAEQREAKAAAAKSRGKARPAGEPLKPSQND